MADSPPPLFEKVVRQPIAVLGTELSLQQQQVCFRATVGHLRGDGTGRADVELPAAAAEHHPTNAVCL